MTVCLSPNGGTVYPSDAPTNTLLVGTLDGIYTLERPGPDQPWEVTRHALEGVHISSLLSEPVSGGLFAGVHGSGLYRSLDGGESWAPRMRGLTQEHVYTLASVERAGEVVLYAGTQPAHLFRSTDYGDTWEELPALTTVPGRESWTFPSPPNQGHVKHLAFDPRDNRTMFLSVEQGCLLKSIDSGQSWGEITGYENREMDRYFKDCHRITISQSSPDTLYMTGGNGMYRSPNSGRSWEHLTDIHFRVGYPDAFFISPLDDQVLFMAGGETDPGTWRHTHTARAGVVRSRDGGRGWEQLRDGLPEYMRASMEAMSMQVWPGGFGFFIGNTDGDVFFSEDQGESWTCIAQGLPPVSKVGHHRHFREPAQV